MATYKVRCLMFRPAGTQHAWTASLVLGDHRVAQLACSDRDRLEATFDCELFMEHFAAQAMAENPHLRRLDAVEDLLATLVYDAYVRQRAKEGCRKRTIFALRDQPWHIQVIDEKLTDRALGAIKLVYGPRLGEVFMPGCGKKQREIVPANGGISAPQKLGRVQS